MVRPDSRKISRASRYSGYCPTRSPSPTGLSPSLAQLPSWFGSNYMLDGSPQPRVGFPSRFGLCPVRSPLLGVSLRFLFLRVLRCFSSPGLLCLRSDISSICRVAPFGYLRINSCVPIPVAFRSLPRPSSPLKA